MGLTDVAPNADTEDGPTPPLKRWGRGPLLLTVLLVAVVAIGLALALHFAVVSLDRERPNIRRTVNTPEALVQALQDARTVGGGTITLSPGSAYRVSQGIEIPDNVTLNGQGARLVVAGNVTSAVTLGNNTKLDDLSVIYRGHGLSLILAPAAKHDITISHCHLMGKDRGQTGILAQPSVSHITIDATSITNVKNAVTLDGTANATLTDLQIRQWTNHGVWAAGSRQSPLSNISLVRVNVGPNVGHGASRYPIVFVTTGDPSRDIVIKDSKVIGPGTAEEQPGRPGTADQISVMGGARDVTIEGNTSIGGGERGINVTSATNVRVTGNTVERSDAAGLGIGSRAPGSGNENVTVSGNKVVDCGLSRMGASATKPTERAGIRLVQVQNGSIVGNTVKVTPGSNSSHTYGITIYRQRDVTVRDNSLSGPMVKRVLMNAG